MNVLESELLAVPLPEETKTYKPVPHGRLLDIVREKSYEYYGEKPKSQSFEISKGGNQLFGKMAFNIDGGEDLCLGFRNSYDKSLAVGVVSGASIIVCSNLMFVGELKVIRKHTVNVYEDLDFMIEDILYSSISNYTRAMDDKITMINEEISNVDAAHILGELYVTEEVLTPTLLSVAKREWESSENFKERNIWSLYNACTEALKKAHPSEIMDRHVDLHKFMMDHIN
jgi:hypothetical protein